MHVISGDKWNSSDVLISSRYTPAVAGYIASWANSWQKMPQNESMMNKWSRTNT